MYLLILVYANKTNISDFIYYITFIILCGWIYISHGFYITLNYKNTFCTFIYLFVILMHLTMTTQECIYSNETVVSNAECAFDSYDVEILSTHIKQSKIW